jgi:hypothetical protein
MFALLRAGLGNALRTKVGLALIGALLVGGGGTAMAMATTHTQLPFGTALSALTHSDAAGKTPGTNKDDQDEGCTSGAHATPSAHASPTAHSDDASEHASGTPSATRSAGQGDDDANEHEGAQDDQDECGTSTATHTPHPEPTERPEGTHTPWPTRSPEPTGTPGPGGGD